MLKSGNRPLNLNSGVILKLQFYLFSTCLMEILSMYFYRCFSFGLFCSLFFKTFRFCHESSISCLLLKVQCVILSIHDMMAYSIIMLVFNARTKTFAGSDNLNIFQVYL